MTTIDQALRATSLEEAFDTLILAQPRIDAALLDALVRRFPEHAAALTDFAVEAVLEYLTRADQVPLVGETDVAVARAMSRFHNRVYMVNQAGEQPLQTKAPANPFERLERTALRDLGVRIGATTVFVMKLRDRQIEPQTIPEGFSRKLAGEMQVPLDAVLAHFASPPTLAPLAHYKADDKPHAETRQTFQEAVQSSGLTESQQARLLSL